MDKDYDILFRLMILGDTGVGKTCLLQRFCDEEFRHSHVYTIGIDFKIKTILVDDLKVRIQIWDTAGQERYRTITRQYYRKAQGMILAYDITDEKSFLNIRNWANDTSDYGDATVQTILVGNKSDREDSRAVSYQEGETLAEQFGMPFIETSAYTDFNVNELFAAISKKIIQAHQKEINDVANFSSSSDDDNEGIVKSPKMQNRDQAFSLEKSEENENSDDSCCIIL